MPMEPPRTPVRRSPPPQGLGTRDLPDVMDLLDLMDLIQACPSGWSQPGSVWKNISPVHPSSRMPISDE